MMNNDTYSKEAEDYEGLSRRIYLVRCVYAVMLIGLFILYRLLPSWPVVALVPVCLIFSWFYDARNVVAEIKKYREFITALASSMNEPVPKSLPKEQSFRKIAFLSLDVTPLYVGPVLIFAILLMHPLPNKLMSSDFNPSGRPYVRMITTQAVHHVAMLNDYFHCCTNCHWWCVCTKDCPCREKGGRER